MTNNVSFIINHSQLSFDLLQHFLVYANIYNGIGVSISFLLLWQNNRAHLQGGKIYFDSLLWRFQPWSVGLVSLCLWKGRTSMAETSGRGCLPHGSLKTEKQTVKDTGVPISPLKSHPNDLNSSHKTQPPKDCYFRSCGHNFWNRSLGGGHPFKP